LTAAGMKTVRNGFFCGGIISFPSHAAVYGWAHLLLKVFTKEMHTKQKQIFLSYQQEWDVLQETGEQTKTNFLETFFAPIPSTIGTG
jgi:hypothetical protein